MNQIEKFRIELKSKIPEDEKHLRDNPLLDSALLYALENRKGDSSPVNLALNRLRQLDRDWPVQPRGEAQSPTTPADRLTSEALEDSFALRAEVLRREVVGSKPLFPNSEDAAAWIEESLAQSEHEHYRSSAGGGEEERRRDFEEATRLVNKHGLYLTPTLARLSYLGKGGQRKDVIVLPNALLFELAKSTESFADSSGVPQQDVVDHVLTGSKMIRPRYSTTFTDGWIRKNPVDRGEGFLTTTHATVRFSAKDINERDVRDVQKQVHAEVTGRGKKGFLKPSHLRVWQLVQARGGPPREHGTKGRFWEAILADLQSEQPAPEPGEKYKIDSARGVEKAYESAVELFKRLV